jgi:mono/diheme cytochrome c family protein
MHARWRRALCATAFVLGSGACAAPAPGRPFDPLVERGRALFFTETFAGNGRTCATCHREEDNFGLSPALIATLPADDPLFVGETVPELKAGFEAPAQMRAHGLIRENLDGFENLETKFTLRGVPHTLALRTSIASKLGPRTGWSGDGAPLDGSLQAFSVGAVIQHFPKTTGRVPGKDFRLPTEEELKALEAFMLSLGRQEDLSLPLRLRDPIALRGQELFLGEGRCNGCHMNAGANADPALFGEGAGNLNFNTGVEALPDQPGRTGIAPQAPPDDGFGILGDATFNTPPVVEAADTAPFFHNNAVSTLEAAVAFYDGESFNASPAGQLILQATGAPVNLDATEIQAIAAFLRAINALENIRAARAYLADAGADRARAARWRAAAREEIADAEMVLAQAHLHPEAVAALAAARLAGTDGEARRKLDAAAARILQSP